jgi:hypothetical protein
MLRGLVALGLSGLFAVIGDAYWIGDPFGYVAIGTSPSDPANSQLVAVSNGGCANSYAAVSTGCAAGAGAAVASGGCATGYAAVSTSCASGGEVAVSGGYASASGPDSVAVGTSGCVTGLVAVSTSCATGGYVAVGLGGAWSPAGGGASVAGTGCAYGYIAVSATNCANGNTLGISGGRTGCASGYAAVGLGCANGTTVGVAPNGSASGIVAMGTTSANGCVAFSPLGPATNAAGCLATAAVGQPLLADPSTLAVVVAPQQVSLSGAVPTITTSACGSVSWSISEQAPAASLFLGGGLFAGLVNVNVSGTAPCDWGYVSGIWIGSGSISLSGTDPVGGTASCSANNGVLSVTAGTNFEIDATATCSIPGKTTTEPIHFIGQLVPTQGNGVTTPITAGYMGGVIWMRVHQ